MVGYITLFLWSVALFVVLVEVVYPRLMLRMKCSVKASLDRGIERIKGDGFLGIVYLPHASIRDKIDRYVIEEKNGVKYLRLNFTEKVRYIDYDVIVFGENNKVIDVLHVKEVPETANYSAATVLPELAAYVSINVNETDAGEEDTKVIYRVPRRRIALYCLCVALTLVAEAIIIKFCLANVFGGIFNESFMLSETFFGTAVIIGGLSFFSVLAFGLLARRKKKK